MITTELRQSLRILRSKPGFSIMAVLMLALGIGACTAIFTVVNGVLLRPLPYNSPDGLVQLFELSDKGSQMNVPEANFVDWKAGVHGTENMAMFSSFTSPLMIGNQAERARLSLVSDGFFDVFKVAPAMGTVSKDAVVVSYGFWQRVLGGSSFTDQRMTVLNQSLPISGVMPAGFGFPKDVEIWVPREIQGPFNPSRSAHNWSVIARLKNGTDATSLSKELGLIAKTIHGSYQDVTAVDAVAIPLQVQMTKSVRVALPVLLAAVGILLLVACANVTNLLLADISSREREVAIRTAIGASPRAIARVFLAQSLTLTALGGVLGVLAAQFAVGGLLAMSAGNLPRIEEIRPDATVLFFAVSISLLVGVVLGIIPGFRAGRLNLDETLKESGRTESHGKASRAVRKGLVIAQVAMTVVLLVAAGLLGRSFVALLNVNLGFETENRFVVEMLGTQAAGTQGRQRLAMQLAQTMEKIRGVPGVIGVGGINQTPLGERNSNGRFLIEGGQNSGEYWPSYRVATSGYFEAMGIPLIRGRLFDTSDGASTPEVAVISQAVAKNVWPNEDPIGRRINFGNMDGDQNYMTIVGIVGDVRNAPAASAGGAVYVNSLQRGYVGNFSIVVRAAGSGESLIPAVTEQIHTANPEMSLRVQTLDQMFSTNMSDRRFNFTLLAVFGGTALLLALLGVYGVTAYSVAQRRQEIGIRIALGAQSSDVMRLFMGEGSKLVLGGIAIGVAGAVAASRVLSSLLFNVQTTDVPTYLLAILPMFAAALLASHLPSRRAARVDPMITIQHRD
jgi:putative ABC transport system permease protein